MSQKYNKSNANKNSYGFRVHRGTVKVLQESATNTPGDLSVDNVHSFYLGRHKIRNGDRIQKFSRAPDLAMEFYHKYSNIFKSQRFDLDRGVIMDGCFKSNKATIQRSMIPETDSKFSGLPSMNLIKTKSDAIKTVIKKLQRIFILI